MTLPDRVWDNISRSRQTEKADIAVKFTCKCGWITNVAIHDISKPISSYLPPGWLSVAPDIIRCPDHHDTPLQWRVGR